MASHRPRNILLRSIDDAAFALLEPHLKAVDIKVQTPLYEANRPIETVYFLEDGVASIVSEQDSGRTIEIGIHGREGMSGVPVVLGAGQSPHASMIQVGDAPSHIIASERLLDACEQSPALKSLLLRYAHCLSVQTAMTAAANATFELPQRCARWLLMCLDRLDTDRIDLTHDYLAMMLAVRRSGVTVTLQRVEELGAIRTSRGVITVVSRPRLLEIAGDAYGRAEAEYRRLIGPFGRDHAQGTGG